MKIPESLINFIVLKTSKTYVNKIAKSSENYDTSFFENSQNIEPIFKESNTVYNHKMVDMDEDHAALEVIEIKPFGDETPAVMATGSRGQFNGVVVIRDGKSVDVAEELGLQGTKDEASYGLAEVDIDGDGVKEIVESRTSGIYVHKRNPETGKYEEKKLDLNLPESAIPLSIEFSDTQKNGKLDMYVSTFIEHKKAITANFNDESARVDNKFYRNNGNCKFTDATKEAGLELHQNGFMAKFVDLNGNGYDDLVVALNTDRVYMYENLMDGTFKRHTIVEGYGYWMGIAVEDVTGNGYPDIYLTNVGHSLPTWMLKGDTTPEQPVDLEFKFLKNEGDYKFTEVGDENGANTNVFGWGALFADFTNNGKHDLVVTENYTAFPGDLHGKYPTQGKVLLQGDDGKFYRAEKRLGLENRQFGYRTIAVDLNKNGYNDLIIANLNGPLRIFINEGTKSVKG